MRIREKQLVPWIVATKDGVIKAAHCNCQAGLGECCSHVAALMFSLDIKVRLRDSKTVTEKPAYWMLPQAVKKIDYNELREIDFTTAKTMKKRVDSLIENSDSVNSAKPKPRTVQPTPIPTAQELSQFYKSVHDTQTKPVILSLIDSYSEDYVPKPISKVFPTVLTELRDEQLISSNFGELLEKCNLIKLEVTAEQAKEVESATREQAKSKVWYRFRAGRITASKVKSVCKTNMASPAQSLIKSICYPESSKFSSEATRWGCDHEKAAINQFLEHMKPFHDALTVAESGLIINPKYPHIGASPDGVVSCNCCGTFVLEVKCPHCSRNKKLCDNDKKNFCLEKLEDGRLRLKRDHSYFYQVQTQLGVSEYDDCFFVVWTQNDLHVERISLNQTVWKEICDKSEVFFKNAILPELVGRFYSRLPSCDSARVLKPVSDNVVLSAGSCKLNDTNDDPDKTWCYCDQVESGNMILCDNENCHIQWFHYECVGLDSKDTIIKGNWYCPDCRKRPEFKRGKKRKEKF